MSEIYTFITANADIISAIELVINLVVGVLIFIRTKNKKYLQEVIMEYRNEHYDKTKNEKQTFSAVRSEFRLNKNTNMLEKTGEVNLDEFVNSFDAQTLKAIYERFFPVTTQDEAIAEYNSTGDKLDLMQEAFATAEEFRSKYNLPADMHFSDVFKYVETKNEELKNKINNVNLVKELQE